MQISVGIGVDVLFKLEVNRLFDSLLDLMWKQIVPNPITGQYQMTVFDFAVMELVVNP